MGLCRATVFSQRGEDGVDANGGHDVGWAGGEAGDAGIAVFAEDVVAVNRDGSWAFAVSVTRQQNLALCVARDNCTPQLCSAIVASSVDANHVVSDRTIRDGQVVVIVHS